MMIPQNRFKFFVERLKEALCAQTQVDISNALGVTQASVCKAFKKRVFPQTWKVTLTEVYSINPLRVEYGDKYKKYLIQSGENTDEQREIQRPCGENNFVPKETIPASTTAVPAVRTISVCRYKRRRYSATQKFTVY
ncbi:MAG: hypothetical protein IJU37_12195 [Desulfovibrio sp.]|nr:hypothetical protein [Desulfovibrio sp.]